MFKRNNKSLFGFTLTELLIALTIIGVIAGLTIPSLMENIQKRLLITQLKSSIGAIQQLTNNQMIYYKTSIVKINKCESYFYLNKIYIIIYKTWYLRFSML